MNLNILYITIHRPPLKISYVYMHANRLIISCWILENIYIIYVYNRFHDIDCPKKYRMYICMQIDYFMLDFKRYTMETYLCYVRGDANNKNIFLLNILYNQNIFSLKLKGILEIKFLNHVRCK